MVYSATQKAMIVYVYRDTIFLPVNFETIIRQPVVLSVPRKT